MPQEDYLLKYLEKLSRVIAAMLGFREKGLPEEAIKVADETFKELLDLKLIELEKMTSESFIEKIRETRYSASFIGLLAELTYETAENKAIINDISAKSYYQKSLELFNYLNEKDKTYSFDRELKIEEIKSKIEELTIN